MVLLARRGYVPKKALRRFGGLMRKF